MKNLQDLFELMNGKKFPEKECVLKVEEEGILESNKYYLCLVIDKDFKDRVEIIEMRPYICLYEGQVLYGWVDKSGNFVDHYEKAIHNDDRRVVAFVEKQDSKNNSLWKIEFSQEQN